MDTARVIELTEDISGRAEQLKDTIVKEERKTPPYTDILALRRMIDTLEFELRNYAEKVHGDAC